MSRSTREIALSGSRWAKGTAPRSRSAGPAIDHSALLSPEQRRILKKCEELPRFDKLLRRIKWKSCHLLNSAHAAIVNSDGFFVGNYGFNLVSADRETMFRIDFYEFYVLLEKALVSAFKFFDVSISGEQNLNDGVPPLPGSTMPQVDHSQAIIGDSKAFAHKFHENVLLAIDDKDNPLHQVLGQGKVRAYLSFAKEFRNRWKDVENDSGNGDSVFRGLKYYKDILNEEDMRLEAMLPSILNALDAVKMFIDHEARRAGLDQINLDNYLRATQGGLNGSLNRPRDEPEEAVDGEMMDIT